MQVILTLLSSLYLLALIFLSLITSYILAPLVPWTRSSSNTFYYSAFAFAVSPFLLGSVLLTVLITLPGLSAFWHLMLAAIISLSLPIFLVVFRARPTTTPSLLTPVFSSRKSSTFIHLASIFLFGSILISLLTIYFVPLAQNDSLEYMIAAKEVYLARTIDAYPSILSQSNVSGFYGPVTHPPLYILFLYFSRLVQDNPVTLFFPRLVSLYFWLSSILALIILGSRISTLVGFIAGVFCFLAPLATLGATSSLIDPLFIASSTLLLVTLSGINTKSIKSSIPLGLLVGVSLWSHSQSILLLPITSIIIVLSNGFQCIRLSLRYIVIVAIISLLVISPVYVKNYSLFGAFLSDNPPVFNLASLEWPLWFQFNRGLDNQVAVIQYGIFKGLFSPESYGPVFFFVLPSSFVLSIKLITPRLFRIGFFGTDPVQKPFIVALTFVSTYFFLILLSVALGTDIMIKNERYLLLILPPAALLASYSLSSFLVKLRKLYRSPDTNIFYSFLVFSFASIVTSSLILILFLIQSLPILYRLSYNLETLIRSSNPQGADLLSALLNSVNSFASQQDLSTSAQPDIRATAYLNTLPTKADSLVLALRPSTMYYSKHRMLSYLDPSLIPFYESKTKLEAFNRLQNLGVDYIQSTGYSLPTFYNSYLSDILADPSLSSLIFHQQGSQLYSFGSIDNSFTYGPVVNLLASDINWSKQTGFNVAGRKRLPVPSLSPGSINNSFRLSSSNPFFHRHIILSAVSPDLCSPTNVSYLTSGEYLLELSASGKGNLRIYLDGDLMLDLPMSPNSLHGPTRKIRKRLYLNDFSDCIFRFEVNGQSDIIVNSLTLRKIIR